MTVPRPLLLAILDGWGVSAEPAGNAILAANTPVMDRLLSEYPNTVLGASGEAVGLPPGQMGNSEVGHLNIGAGRVVLQDYQRINHAIASSRFKGNPVLRGAIERAVRSRGTLHLMGLLSDGGVHSHIEHMFALLEMAVEIGAEKVVNHAFLDGRDVPPRSALKYVERLEKKVRELGVGEIRTIGGRYYYMDRDNRWERTKLAYDAAVRARGDAARTASEAVELSYERGVNDEFVVPHVVGAPVPMDPADSVIFYNFRPDRPRQLIRALIDRGFDSFDRGSDPVFPRLVTMTDYDETFGVPVAFVPEEIKNVLAEVLERNGKTQLHIAETEKYAHVTYFFNGGIEDLKPGEDRVLIQSPKVATYDLQPEMSAFEVASEAVRRIWSGNYDFIALNFANCDMVGHSGIMEAAVKAVEAVDTCLGKVLDAVWSQGGGSLVTADHGNADEMVEDGHACTAHSCSPVPLINVTSEKKPLREGGNLGDIAPTILDIMELPQPAQMTGRSLFLPLRVGGEGPTIPREREC